MSDVDVALEAGAAPAELDAVRAVVREVSNDWTVEANFVQKSADVVAQLLIAGPVAAFLGAFAAEAGKAAWRKSVEAPAKLKRWLDGLRAARGGKVQGITLIDGSLWLEFRQDLPDEAYRKLFEIEDLADRANKYCWLAWDDEKKDWLPPLS